MRSSISNSDPASTFGRPFRPLALALAIGVATWAAVWALGTMDPVRDGDNSHLRAAAALGPETRLLAIGTSHVLCGVDPGVVWTNAVNIATAGADYETMLLILRQHWPALTALEAVLLEVDNICISNLGLARRDFRDVYDYGVPRSALPLKGWPKIRQALIEHPAVAPIFFSTRLTPWAWVRRPTAERVLKGPGFEVYTGRVYAAVNGLAKIRAHESVLSPFSAERNRTALVDILTLLESRRVPVLLFTLPHDEHYTANAGPVWRATFEQTIQTARAYLGERFVWWDLDRHPAFSDEDFNDGHHVNDRGAQKLSLLLRDMLHEELVRDRRP